MIRRDAIFPYLELKDKNIIVMPFYDFSSRDGQIELHVLTRDCKQIYKVRYESVRKLMKELERSDEYTLNSDPPLTIPSKRLKDLLDVLLEK